MIASWSSPLSRVFSTTSFSVRFGILIGVLLISGPLLSPEHGCAQDTETQQLSFEQGENFVSLRVQPEDASLSAIFEGHLDQIHRIKDERGRVYMPGDGIEQFTTWDANEGYKVYTTSPFDLAVTGSPLSLTTASVPLKKGWNLIPYLPAEPQAADDALASVSNTLLRVEGEDENAYEPDGSSSLDSLRVGQGYALYVDQPDTLTYTIQTGTLAEALSLGGVQAGQHVHARGRDEPGDGGGGTFVVTNSDCGTDGATCFIFDDDRASVTGETVSASGGATLSNSDLVWGTVECRYGPDPEDVVKDLRLAGHHVRYTGSGGEPWIDHAAGQFNGGGWAPFNSFDSQLGNGDGTMDVSYEHATSARRLERKNVTEAINLAWYGAPKADPNNPASAGPYLSWALSRAAELYQNNNFDWTYVDVPGEYYVRNRQLMFSGVRVRGTGDLNADGFTRGTLKLMPGEALYHLKKEFQDGDGWYRIQNDTNRKRAHMHYGGREKFLFSNSKFPEKFAFEAITVSGNLPNNRGPFDNRSDYSHPNNSIERYLQDSGDWMMFYSKNDYNDQTPLVLDDVHARKLGGSGIGIAGKNEGIGYDTQTPGKVIIDTAYRNHLWYGLTTQGWIENVTLKGTYWGGNPISGSAVGPNKYRNIIVKDLYDNPDYTFNSIFGDRDGEAQMENITVDLRGSTQGFKSMNVLINEGQNLSVDGFTVHSFYDGDTNASKVTFYKKRLRGKDTEGPVSLKNVTLVDEGTPITLHSEGNGNRHDVIFENVTVEEGDSPSGDGDASTPGFNTAPLGSKAKAARLDYKNVDILVPVGEFDLAQRGGSGPTDHYWQNSTLNTTAPSLFFHGNFSGDEWSDPAFFFDNVQFDGSTPQDGYMEEISPPEKGSPEIYVRMRNCTATKDGTTLYSEQSGTYTSDGGDEGNDYVLIPTDLLSYAWGRTATVTSGERSVQSIEVTDSNGNPRTTDIGKWTKQTEPYMKVNLDAAIQTGNTIDVDWTARVTRKEDYKTTGLFVARPVSDKTYTSGKGPFTIDLRGVASSQESRDKIVYTASSGDTSVVTAGVQGDDYTLELTEQGTGTATITVTSEVEDVGTETITFEVAVD